MALKPQFGGTCDCGGEIYEVRAGVPSPGGDLIIGPGRHVGWKCRNCDKEYPFMIPSAGREAMKRAMQPLFNRYNK